MVEQFRWLVIPCIKILEKNKDEKVLSYVSHVYLQKPVYCLYIARDTIVWLSIWNRFRFYV